MSGVHRMNLWEMFPTSLTGDQPMTGVHIYYPPGSRNNQQSKLPIKQPTRESRRGEPTPLGSLDSLVAIDISVYAQPELRSSSRVAGSSARRVSAELRIRMRNKNSRRNYVRTPRVVRVVQCPILPLDHQKPQYSSDFLTTMSSGPMQIRNCGSEDRKKVGGLSLSIVERYVVTIGPPDTSAKNTLPSCDFEWSSGETGHWTTRTSTSGVIV